MKKEVVVFGGAGFMGSYLVQELLNRNYHVIYADLFPQNHLPSGLYRKCNILNIEEVNSIIDETTDFVYNLAGFANLDQSVHNPIDTINLNVNGNLNILEVCRQKMVKRFIYASSAYAMSNKGSFYSISKLSSEKIIEEYEKQYSLKFTILRYGSIYSELPSENNYIYNLINRAIKSREIYHQGDGEEYREYIHAKDASKLSVDILEDSQYENQHLILTGVERLKRIELFNMIKEILNDDNISVVLEGSGYEHHYKYTPYAYQPALSKKLVANPFIDIGQGLLECIKSIIYSNDI